MSSWTGLGLSVCESPERRLLKFSDGTVFRISACEFPEERRQVKCSDGGSLYSSSLEHWTGVDKFVNLIFSSIKQRFLY